MELGFYLLAAAVLIMMYLIHIMWKNIEYLNQKNDILSTLIVQLLEEEVEENILILAKEKEND